MYGGVFAHSFCIIIQYSFLWKKSIQSGRLSTNLEKSNAQDSSAVVVGVGGEGGATRQEHAQLTTNNAAQVLED